MAAEDTLGYAALSQMLRGREERRQDDRLRQQNNLQDERADRQATNNAFMDIDKTQELEKAKQAAANQASLDRMALERSRSADRNLALHTHDENADLARAQQKDLADMRRAQQEEQLKTRHTEREAQLFAHFAGMKNAEGQPVYQDADAYKMAKRLMAQQAAEETEATPVSTMPAAGPTSGPPQGASSQAAGSTDFLAPRNTTNFASPGARAKYQEEMAGNTVHYEVGKSILNDVLNAPDNMFGAGKSLLRAGKAETERAIPGTQSEQDKLEYRIETNVNTKMTKWLSDLLLSKSGKTVGVGEFIRLAKAVGMAPSWIERSAKSLTGAITMLGGAALGGGVGALAGEKVSELTAGLVGEITMSIFNKPNKRAAVEGLQDYLNSVQQEAGFKAGSYNQKSPLEGESINIAPPLPSAPAPPGYSGVPEYRSGRPGRAPSASAPISDRMKRILEISKKHLSKLTGEQSAEQAPPPANGRNYNPDED